MMAMMIIHHLQYQHRGLSKFFYLIFSTNDFFLQIDYLCMNYDSNDDHTPPPEQGKGGITREALYKTRRVAINNHKGCNGIKLTKGLFSGLWYLPLLVS